MHSLRYLSSSSSQPLAVSTRSDAAVHSFTNQFLNRANTSIHDDQSYGDLVNRCNEAMSYWSKRRDRSAAINCQAIFDRIEELNAEGRTTTELFELDTDSYNTLISVWCESKDPWSAHKANEALEKMEEAHVNNISASTERRSTVNPNGLSYNMVIQKWCQNMDDLSNWNTVDKVLERYIERFHSDDEFEAAFDTQLFTAMISAYPLHRTSRIVETGQFPVDVPERIHSQMESLYKNDGVETCKPSTATYSALLRYYSDRARSPWLTSRLLERMYMLYSKHGDEYMAPNADSYNIVLETLAKSKIRSKAKMSGRTLLRMARFYMDGHENAKPSVTSFNFVISSAASTSLEASATERRAAFRVASIAFKQLQNPVFDSPNSKTYGLMLEACANLLPFGSRRRAHVVNALFQSCVSEGQVNTFVIESLRKAASTCDFNDLTGLDNIEEQKILPSKWSRNVIVGDDGDRIVVSTYGKIADKGAIEKDAVNSFFKQQQKSERMMEKKGQKLLRGGRSD